MSVRLSHVTFDCQKHYFQKSYKNKNVIFFYVDQLYGSELQKMQTALYRFSVNVGLSKMAGS